MSPRLTRFAPVLIFFLGLLAGVALSVLWVGHRLRGLVENGPTEFTRIGIAAVARRLDLDPEQRARLEPLFTRIETNFVTMHREDLIHVRRVMEDAAAELRPQLRPAQQAELDELLVAPRRRWARFIGPEGVETIQKSGAKTQAPK